MMFMNKIKEKVLQKEEKCQCRKGRFYSVGADASEEGVKSYKGAGSGGLR